MARIRSSPAETRTPLAGWSWRATAPDAVFDPRDLPAEGWADAIVPGTVGAILRARHEPVPPDLDASDHWYRTHLPRSLAGRLRFEGLATLCDIWVGGEKRAESESMVVPLDLALEAPAGTEIALRFRALAPHLETLPRRSRWRPALIAPNALRHVRTTALGSMPGWCPPGRPVGPWRPVEMIEARSAVRIEAVRLAARYDAPGGSLAVRLTLASGSERPARASIACAGGTAPLSPDGDRHLSGRLELAAVAPWWPHTHGAPALHPVTLDLDGETFDLGPTGFRTIAVDRDADGQGFGLVVNGVPVFCRGATWTSPDIVALPGTRQACEPWLRAARDAGMNMIRVPGITLTESDAFYDLCDELGILVWQDAMLANFDYPQGVVAFCAALAAEVRSFLDRTEIAPSLAVFCGGSEVFQQAAMLGGPPATWGGPIFDELLPGLVAERRPDVLYVPNSPSGGALPFVADAGVTHYYGVGAYLRPLEDARRARVRFAAECLAFANVPEDRSLERAGVPRIAHHPDWKSGVPRDPGAPWDFEDPRDHYLRELYGLDPMALRRSNPERYLALSRAAVAEVMEQTFAEWRRPGAPTRGALVWTLMDVMPGAGWGVIASDGEPKSAWHALRRAFRPRQVCLTDEGVNGLAIHVLNEGPSPLAARLEITCWRDGAVPVVRAERDVALGANAAATMSAFDLMGRFFDITYAYKFGPPGHDATSVTLVATDTGAVLAEAFHFPLGRAHVPASLGLRAAVAREGDGWAVTVETDRVAQSVTIVDDHWRAAETGFHLAPGRAKRVALLPRGSDEPPPMGHVAAVNALDVARYGAGIDER